MEEAILQVKNVTKTYPNGEGIENINMEISEFGIYGLLGENGAGKSTLMNVITGYTKATEGNVIVCGYDIFKNSVLAKANLSYLPETPPLYDDMTVKEFLSFVAGIRNIVKSDREKRIEIAMNETLLEDVKDRLIKNLSKGYRQRVGLAQAILSDSFLIILDEPINGLDPTQIAQMRDLILKLKENHAIVISSHILSEMEDICDKVFIMANGKIVFDGALNELEKGGESLEAAFLNIISQSKLSSYEADMGDAIDETERDIEGNNNEGDI